MTTVTYSFDEEFQSCVAALALRDVDFCIRTDGLIRPEYFTSEIEGSLFAIWQDHFQTYRRLPADPGVIKEVLAKGIKESRIRKDMIPDVKGKLAELIALKIADREFIIDKVSEFAKHQALSAQERFVHQGDIWPHFFIIADGVINLSKESQEGRIFLITTLKTGDVFWGLAF